MWFTYFQSSAVSLQLASCPYVPFPPLDPQACSVLSSDRMHTKAHHFKSGKCWKAEQHMDISRDSKRCLGASVFHFCYLAFIIWMQVISNLKLADAGIHCYQTHYNFCKFTDLKFSPNITCTAGINRFNYSEAIGSHHLQSWAQFPGQGQWQECPWDCENSHSSFHIVWALSQRRSMWDRGSVCMCLFQLAAAWVDSNWIDICLLVNTECGEKM